MEIVISSLYRLLLKKGLRGRGILLRSLARFHPQAHRYPLEIEGLGTVHVDLRIPSVLAFVDYAIGGGCEVLGNYIGHFLRKGDTLWDIGANVGTLSIHFAQSRYGLASIEAFEPNPELVPNLRLLFENLPQVHVNGVALGDRPSTANLYVPSAADTARASLNGQSGGTAIPVSVIRGDDFWQQSERPLPDVIKIDVEGFEPAVFAGLQTVIAKASPVIFFEHIFLSAEAVEKFIPPGYSRYYILDEGGLTKVLEPGGRSHDSILVPVARMHEVPDW